MGMGGYAWAAAVAAHQSTGESTRGGLEEARPHCGVALEPRSEGELQDLLAAAERHVRLDPRKLVPVSKRSR